MTLLEDDLALIRESPNIGPSNTLIGASDRISEEEFPTRDTDDDGGKEEASVPRDNGGKKPRYSSMSAEVSFTDGSVLQKKMARKADVRFLNIKHKIKTNGFLSCDQQQCPKIQARLDQHNRVHHSKHKRTDKSCGTRTEMQDRGVNVSPTLSRMRVPKFTLPYMEEGCSVQTDISMRDISPTSLFIQKPEIEPICDYNGTLSIRETETRDVPPKRNFYREQLENEVLLWLDHVPLFFSLNFTTKDMKGNVVNNLVEKINVLANEANDQNYEIKIKMVIKDCLNKLPMWLHGTKREQILFKDSLKDKLWNRIVRLNGNFLYLNDELIAGNENLDEKLKSHLSYENEIIDWSQRLLLDPGDSVTRRQVVDLLMKTLSPLLKLSLHTTSYKLILKGAIVDILDVLPLTVTNPAHKTVQLNKLAEDLANRLLNIQIKHESSSLKNSDIISPSVFLQLASQVTRLPIPKSLHNYKDYIRHKVCECLDNIPVCNRNDLKTEICSSFVDSETCLCTGSKITIKDEISQYLRDTGKTFEDNTQIIANMILKHVSDGLKDVGKADITNFNSVTPQLSGTISVYRYGSENPPTTSTPKKAKNKDVPKLNPEETLYIEKVAALITVWMNTLPKQYDEEPGFKKTVIYDLAGELMDHQKLQQLAPVSVSNTAKYQKYLIYKWLSKFDFFTEEQIRTDSVPLVADFQRRLKDIPVPTLTASQHGTRQGMEHIKHMHGGHGWDEDYVAKGIDLLEDQISVWMNEQPSEIYNNKDKGKRNKMIHNLALNLQDHLRSQNPESEIEADINQWLKQIVSPKEKEHIDLLTQDLKDKIIDLPQDRTLGVRHEERQRDIQAKIAAKRQQKEGKASTQATEDVSNIGNIQGDPDKTIREFLGKYIEHYYDIADPMAMGAFAHLLKTELRKLAPPTRKEVYENFEQLKTHQRFMPESLKLELEYIKIISDWLNNLPMDPSYNTVSNKRRIEYINDLARNIQEIEGQRNENPNVLDHNFLIASMIISSMDAYELPILSEYRCKTHIMAHQLLEKIVNMRTDDTYDYPTSSGNKSQSSSFNMSDVKEQNLSDFINDYIRVNGREIADDELKLEAWTARLLKEVKKMIHEGADPTTLTKAQVYEKFAGVPLPTEESVEAFSLKIYYVKEITDWMKNLPLLPIQNQPEYADKRIRMISELSEMMCDTEVQKRAHPSDNSAGKKLEEYISTWISSLPLDKSKDINMPILIQQLMIRMKKGSKRHSKLSLENQSRTTSEESKASSKKRDKKKKSQDKEDKQIISKRDSKACGSVCSKSCRSPAERIVLAIETWSNKLPIKLDDKDTVKTMREGIARQLYQKVSELNGDPKIFNDDLLYRDMLDDEIETQLENVPQNSELQNNREQIKEGLINQFLDSNKAIKEISAGDNYRHKLETTIDASIPNPVQTVQAFDPGFEIYKNHLANIFILENFDHANDDVKATHEKRVRREMDKYFQNAQNKNAFPLTKDQIYNEIYSALFKVPMPHENSVINEVEQVKTRCEIDAWYEKLPVQETDNLNELLERDQILSTLAKRIQEIEKDGHNADENIKRETRKWLEKIPLTSGQQGINEHVKQLQSLLKSTAAARKYVSPETASKGKSKKGIKSKSKKGANDPNTSQVAGPSGVPPRVSALQSKSTTAKPCYLVVGCMTNKKPGDLIVEIVEEWCNKLPLISTEENNKGIIDNIATRLIIQISELNMDPEIFNDDIVYDELLDEELENVMSNLPVCCDFEKSKPARKDQLKQQINSIKPLIKADKEKHEYKQELNSTVARILKDPLETSADKKALLNKLKEEIVKNFIQYYYHINYDEGRNLYKNQIHDAVIKFCTETRDSVGAAEKVDPLVRRNQLFCELQKIPAPESALKEEVAEINMKKEVEQFLREQSVPEGDARDTMTKHLAKRLCDIERSGYNPTNVTKMKSDIIRGLTKLKKDLTPETVEAFVIKLKYNEAERKALPLTSSQASNLNQCGSVQDRSSSSPKLLGTSVLRTATQMASQTPRQGRVPFKTEGDETWASRHASMPYYGPISKSPIGIKDFESGHSPSYFPGDQDITSHARPPTCLTSVAGRHPRNLNASLGSAQSSGRLTQQGLNTSYPQYQQTRMKEATSGPMLSRPSFVQNATPRQVAQSQASTTLMDTTSDSLFQAPIFQPDPLSFDTFQPAGFNRQGGRRPQTGQNNALVTPTLHAGRPIAGDRRPTAVESSDDDEICVCERCSPNLREIPFCLMSMDDSIEDCLDHPMLYGQWTFSRMLLLLIDGRKYGSAVSIPNLVKA